MEKYYVDTQTNMNGHTEVHKSQCRNLPGHTQLFYLGLHVTCDSAVLKAKSKGYIFSNGCKYCIEECHTHSSSIESMIL